MDEDAADLIHESFNTVANNEQFKSLRFLYTYHITPITNRCREYVGLKNKKSPNLVIVDYKKGKNFTLDDEINVESITTFCNNFLKDTLSPFELELPLNPKILDILGNKTSDILLFIFAEDDLKSQSAFATMKTLNNALIDLKVKNYSTIFLTFDSNELPLLRSHQIITEVNVPIVKFFKSNAKMPTTYTEPITQDALLQFVFDNISEKFNMEEAMTAMKKYLILPSNK